MSRRIFPADLRATKALRRISCKRPQEHIRAFYSSPSVIFRKGIFVWGADVLSESALLISDLCDSEVLTPHRDEVECNCRSRTFEYQPLHHVFSSQFDRPSMRLASDDICRINLEYSKADESFSQYLSIRHRTMVVAKLWCCCYPDVSTQVHGHPESVRSDGMFWLWPGQPCQYDSSCRMTAP